MAVLDAQRAQIMLDSIQHGSAAVAGGFHSVAIRSTPLQPAMGHSALVRGLRLALPLIEYASGTLSHYETQE